MLGRHEVAGERIRFTPRFPLRPGVRYRVTFDPAALPGSKSTSSGTITAVFSLPREDARASSVVRVDPAVDRLPENLLKFYITFRAPMSRGMAYEHLQLLDATGRPVDDPFLELGEELWDPSQTRFTLLLDPGRIKRGLKPREDDGPILEVGKSYTLVIDQGWLDARGRPLPTRHEKRFQVGPPDDDPPVVDSWTISEPRIARTGRPKRAELRVRSPEPLDRALFGRCLTVLDAAGGAVPGHSVVSEDATRWTFQPNEGWRPGRYRIVVDARLEDLAGNSIGRPFEVDVLEPIQKEISSEFVERPFEVLETP